MSNRDDTRKFVQEKGPLIVFSVFTFGGMILIWFGKLFGVNTTAITVIPVLLMFVYFLSAFLASGLRLHNEQAGDNLYYMGFLYTLSSLGVSLYLFSGEASIDTIVRNFGVALTSTIAGVTLRIMFNQMRRDPIDIDRTVRHELAEMTRRVRIELDTSSREFSSYRRTSNQMLSEGFEEIARQAEKNGEQILKSIEAMSSGAIKPIQAAAEKLAEVLDQNGKAVEERANANALLTTEATEKMEQAAERLTAVIEAFSVSVASVTEKFDTMDHPENVMRSEMQPTITAIQALTAEHFNRMEASAASEHKNHSSLQDSLKPLQEIAGKLELIVTALSSKTTENSAFSVEDIGANTGVPSQVGTLDAGSQKEIEQPINVSPSSEIDMRLVETPPRHNETQVATAETSPSLGSTSDGFLPPEAPEVLSRKDSEPKRWYKPW